MVAGRALPLESKTTGAAALPPQTPPEVVEVVVVVEEPPPVPPAPYRALACDAETMWAPEGVVTRTCCS